MSTITTYHSQPDTSWLDKSRKFGQAVPWPVYSTAGGPSPGRRSMTRRAPDDRNLKKSDIITVVAEAPKK